jgi:hypothetical protein
VLASVNVELVPGLSLGSSTYARTRSVRSSAAQSSIRLVQRAKLAIQDLATATVCSAGVSTVSICLFALNV